MATNIHYTVDYVPGANREGRAALDTLLHIITDLSNAAGMTTSQYDRHYQKRFNVPEALHAVQRRTLIESFVVPEGGHPMRIDEFAASVLNPLIEAADPRVMERFSALSEVVQEYVQHEREEHFYDTLGTIESTATFPSPDEFERFLASLTNDMLVNGEITQIGDQLLSLEEYIEQWGNYCMSLTDNDSGGIQQIIARTHDVTEQAKERYVQQEAEFPELPHIRGRGKLLERYLGEYPESDDALVRAIAQDSLSGGDIEEWRNGESPVPPVYINPLADELLAYQTNLGVRQTHARTLRQEMVTHWCDSLIALPPDEHMEQRFRDGINWMSPETLINFDGQGGSFDSYVNTVAQQISEHYVSQGEGEDELRAIEQQTHMMVDISREILEAAREEKASLRREHSEIRHDESPDRVLADLMEEIGTLLYGGYNEEAITRARTMLDIPAGSSEIEAQRAMTINDLAHAWLTMDSRFEWDYCNTVRVLCEALIADNPPGIDAHEKANVHAILGYTYIETDPERMEPDPQKAENCFRIALLENPGNKIALGGKGTLALQKGDMEEACAMFQRVLAMDLHHKYAYKKMQEVVDAVSRELPLFRKVRALREAGEHKRVVDETWQEALAMPEETLLEKTTKVYILHSITESAERCNVNEDYYRGIAIRLCDASLAIKPDDSVTLWHKGQAHIGIDNVEAERCLRAALELHPDSEVIINSLGILCVNRGTIDAALDYFDRTLRINPRNELALRSKNTFTQYQDESNARIDELKAIPPTKLESMRARKITRIKSKTDALETLLGRLVEQLEADGNVDEMTKDSARELWELTRHIYDNPSHNPPASAGESPYDAHRYEAIKAIESPDEDDRDREMTKSLYNKMINLRRKIENMVNGIERSDCSRKTRSLAVSIEATAKELYQISIAAASGQSSSRSP